MGLFRKKSEGGFMDVIRCDQQEYLVWKWRPSGEANSSKKENTIRYGSSLRIKDGELAVFVYEQQDGGNQDFITGPHDQTIKTANFPILTGIVGSAFGGGFGGFGGQRQRVVRGSNLRVRVNLTLEEISKGVDKKIKVKRRVQF